MIMFPVHSVMRVVSSTVVTQRPAPGLIERSAGLTSRGSF
jgi:hypothetical protein